MNPPNIRVHRLYRRVRRARSAWLPLSLVGLVGLVGLLGMTTGCAGSLGGAAARRYQRAGLEQLPLRSIDVAVTVAGPPATSSPRFSVPSFEPPTLSSVIRPAVEEPATRAALVARLRRRLVEAGFQVRMFHADAASPAKTSTAAAGVGSSSTSVAVDDVERPLGPGLTVQDVLSGSRADAVLVVRVVPVDAFYIFVESDQTRLIDLGGGTLPRAAGNDRPVVRAGRLLVGQAFLFDRKTGARLWTRHLPDLPEDGRIFDGDPFLEYGFVADEAAGEPSPSERAEASSTAFVAKMFKDFPAPNAGGDAGTLARADLDAVDLQREQRRERFLDANRFAVEIGGNWTYQRVGIEGTLNDEQAFPDLETGFVAPGGALRIEPRVSYLVAGGWTASVGGQFGTIPGENTRSYFRDSANGDRGVNVQTSGGSLVGLDLRAGLLIPLTGDLFLWPTVGGFYERWSFDVGPETVLPSGSIDRYGALLNADALWRWSDSWFTRGGVGLRVGSASQGGEIIGVEVGLSLGVFL